jgi:hypothetical protein
MSGKKASERLNFLEKKRQRKTIGMCEFVSCPKENRILMTDNIHVHGRKEN